MKKKQYKYFGFYLFTFVFLTAALFCEGCGVVGLVGTPTRHERKIAAEYKLSRHRNQKMVVLVNQPGWLNAQDNLRYYLTKKINESLTEKVKIRPKWLVSYNELSQFRSVRRDSLLLSPVETGAALNADMVLLVTVEGYELNKMSGTDYYKGFLSVKTILRDVSTGENLWPGSGESRSIKVGFEVESLGREAAVDRLARACAHCTTRYFYDCREDKFKIMDDRSDISWEIWEQRKMSGDSQ